MNPKLRNDLIDIASDLAGIDENWLRNASAETLRKAFVAMRREARKVMDDYNATIIEAFNA